MKTIIAGSRTLRNVPMIFKAIEDSKFVIAEVVSGTAGGVDKVGELWAQSKGIPVKRFPAAWEDLSHPDAIIRTRPDGTQYDVRAGGRRNRQMAEYAEALIAIWDGESKGTDDMVEQAQELGLKVHLHIISQS